MSYILIIGILFIALPIIVIEVLAHALLIGMLKDDSDTSNIFNFALGLVVFGIILVGVHFIFS